jgi:hypothetical protein
MQLHLAMPAHIPEIIDHELSERRKSAIYFLVIAAAAIFVAAALLFVLR